MGADREQDSLPLKPTFNTGDALGFPDATLAPKPSGHASDHNQHKSAGKQTQHLPIQTTPDKIPLRTFDIHFSLSLQEEHFCAWIYSRYSC
jgi:hypothetical protein